MEKWGFDKAIDDAVAAERERCAKLVEETPSSRSLYFNSETATALTDFKNYVAKLIRNRK